MLCESLAALALPWVAGLVAGTILGQGTGRVSLHAALILLLAVFAAQAVLRFGAAYTLNSAADRVVASIKVSLYDQLQSLPIGFFNERRLGDSLALLTSDVYVVGGFLVNAAVALAPLALTAAGATLLLFGLRADLAILVVLLVPLVILGLKIAGRRLRPLSARLQDEEAGGIAIAQENLAMLPLIKVFTREPVEAARYRSQVGVVLDLSARQRLVAVALGPTVQLFAGAGVVAVIAIAGADLVSGRMPAAELVAFLLYAQLLVRPVAGLADVYGQTQVARGALGRLEAVMGELPESRAGSSLPKVRGEVEWREVAFAYPGRGPALRGASLRIAAGEWVAIVGPNGAGKSTLGHLLARLHDPDSGHVFIDGTDLAGVAPASVRSRVGVVPQHVMLLNASARENIAYGLPGAAPEAIERAARSAGAHAFIAALPSGYDTVVGERGVRLSGGQQQRIALARALLKDPAILVLDEATSMFDPEAEREFLRTCRQALPDRTIIFITHRPESLRAADRIVHMREGRVEREETAVHALHAVRA
jgi:subfamily B ATP-binding cassette protein MsbA